MSSILDDPRNLNRIKQEMLNIVKHVHRHDGLKVGNGKDHSDLWPTDLKINMNGGYLLLLTILHCHVKLEMFP